jgi:peptide/nickel transport system substrate-binding protein
MHENSLELVDVHTGRLLDWVGLRDTPGASAVAGNTIWTASPTANLVSRVDIRDRTVSRISVGTEPVALAIGGGSVWVANNGSGTVTRIDTRTDDPTEIPGVGVGPSGIAYGDGSVWVTDAGDGVVARIDPARNKVVQRIRVGDGPTGIVVDRDVWIVDTNSHTLERINGASPHRVVRTYQVGNGPVGVAVVGSDAWVTNSLDDTVSRVPIDGTAVTDYPLGAEPRHIAVVDKHLWITSHVTGTVYEFDPKSRAVIHRRSVGAVPDGLAESGSGVWVATTIDPALHRGGTLKLIGLDPQSVDPVFPTETGNWLLNSTWDGLVGFQHETGAAGGLVVPDLAVALPSVSSDGRTYTFQLRRGIHWSTGAPVTVQDVQRGIERAVLELGTTLNTVIAGADRCTVRRCDISGLSVDAAANSVTITLVRANVGFLNLLTAAPAAPPSTPLGHDSTRVIAATGPYRIARYVPRKELDLVRNPYFHEWSHAAQPAGLPDRLEYRIVKGDARSALRAARMVRDGRADWADVREVPDVGATLGGRLHITPAESLWGLSLNTATEPFVHRNARRALAYALDRRSVANTWFTSGIPACQFLPPSSPGYRPYCPYTGARDGTGKWYQNDLTKGLELVRGLDLSVRIGVWATPYTARSFRQVVTALRELGYSDVRLHIVRDDAKYFHYVEDSRNEAQAAFFGWIGGDNSPSELLSLWSCAAIVKDSPDNVNTAQFCDRSIDALMRKARVAQQTSLSAASAVWHHVDRALVDAAPWIPLVTTTYIDAVSERVQGYRRHLWLGPLFDQIRLR